MQKNILGNLKRVRMKTKLTPEIMKKGFTDSFDFILKLNKYPEKLKRLPDKGILTRRGKRFIIKPENGRKLIVL